MVQNQLGYTLYYDEPVASELEVTNARNMYKLYLLMTVYYLLLRAASKVEVPIILIMYNFCLSMTICVTVLLWKERVSIMICALLFLGVKLGFLITRYLPKVSIVYVTSIYTQRFGMACTF